MKLSFAIAALSFVSAPAFAHTLPKACQDLAWKFAQVQVEAEDYAHLDVIADMTARISPDETSVFTMTFDYDAQDQVCLIKTLKAGYR